MQPPIYKPTGAALEYGDLALNIYTGCNHGCTYCYAPQVTHKTREQFEDVKVRPGLIDALKAQLEKEQITGQLIHLCFSCDPYPAKIDTTPTREVIKLLKAAGNHVQILTKGGVRSQVDFDLLGAGDWYGITYCGYPPEDRLSQYARCPDEPNAAPPASRLEVALTARMTTRAKTWCSMEPIIDAADALAFLEEAAVYFDKVMIGKMNHRRSSINWREFGRRAEEICIRRGLNYYIKASLRAEME